MSRHIFFSAIFCFAAMLGMATVTSAQDIVISVTDPQFQRTDSDCIGEPRSRDPWWWGEPVSCDPAEGTPTTTCDYWFTYNRSDGPNMYPELGSCSYAIPQPHQCASDPTPPQWPVLGETRNHCMPADWAIWKPAGSKALPGPGWYEVLAEVPMPSGRFADPTYGDGIAAEARYQIYADGTAYRVSRSHQTSNPELSLGVYPFAADGTEFVYLDDVNPDSIVFPIFQRKIVFADLIFRPTLAPPPSQQTITQDFALGGPQGAQRFTDTAGDPISPTTGNYTLTENDVRIPGPGESELALERFYNAQASHVGYFGRGWTTLADTRVTTYRDGSLTVWFPDGQGRFFEYDGSAYEGVDGVFDTLEATADGWVLTTPNQWTYELEAHGSNDSLGRLLSLTDRHGNAITLSWTNGLPQAMADSAGRSLTFAHQGDRITSMTDPLGRRWSYSYDDDFLVSVTDPRSGVTRYDYGESECMTAITDPEGVTYLNNVYEVVDNRCRVTEQYDAAGSLSTFAYFPGETLFTDNLGNSTTFLFDDAYRRTARIDAQGNTESFVWNDEYQLVQTIDRRGNSWSYSYDSSNNMLSSVCPTGCTTSYAYTAENDLQETTDAVGGITSFTWTNGNPDAIDQADGSQVTLTYDGSGQLATRTDPNGNTTTFSYDSFGNLIRIEDPLGQITTMTYDLAGRRLTRTDGNGHTTQFAYDASDNLISFTDPKGQATIFEYDLNDRMFRRTDRRGGVQTFEYDTLLRLVAMVDGEGHRTEHAYDLMNNRISTRDPRGNTTLFRYDSLYRLIEIEDALAQVTRFEYDSNGNLIRQIDPLGAVTQHTYEPRNLRDSTTDALGGTKRFEHDPYGRLVASINERSARTEYEYDPMHRLTLTRDALGAESTNRYDPAGNLVEKTDANGHSTYFVHDQADRLISTRDPEGHVSALAYDATRNLTQVTNPRNARTRFEYDANDNLIRMTDALGGVAEFAFDAEDNRTHVTDPNGNTTQSAYDLDGLLIGILEAGGQESELTYDANHNLTALTNAKGNTTARAYDPLNRLTLVTDPLGHETRFAYDPLGRLTEKLDAESNAMSYGYDLLGRLVSVTDALSHETAYSYDAVGNLIQILDANAHATDFDYDLLDRLVQETNAVGSVWQYRYDAVGNMVEHRNARGQRITHSYDADNLLVQSSFPDKPDVSRTYDVAHNLTHMVDGLGTTEQLFDLLNRLTSSTNHAGQEVVYTYDPAGNRTSFRHEDGSLIRYEYDQNNRQNKVIDPNGNTFDADYDLTHNITGISYPNATEAELAYDAADRLTRLTNRQLDGDLISDFEYLLDRVGNRTQTTETYRWPQPRSVTTDYVYDPKYQLVRSSDTMGRFSEYQFDAVGNRQQLTSNYDPYRTPTDVAPYTLSSAYDDANRLVQAAHSVFGTTHYAYDADGNRVGRQGPNVWTGAADTLRTESEFDSENRITRIANSRQVNPRRWQLLDETTMAYDGFDRLYRRTYDKKQGGGGAKWSDFVYDGLDPVSEYVHPSPQYTTYHRGLGRMLSLREKRGGGRGNLYYYHHDGLGSVSALTKHNGQSVHAYRYSDYGVPLDNNGRATDSSNFTNPHNHFTFTGQEWVEQTWNLHFHAREYDPVAGVWTRADDLRGVPGQPFSLHRYQYVGNNPINFVDLYGYERTSSSPCAASSENETPGPVYGPQYLAPPNGGAVNQSTQPLSIEVFSGTRGLQCTIDGEALFQAAVQGASTGFTSFNKRLVDINMGSNGKLYFRQPSGRIFGGNLYVSTAPSKLTTGAKFFGRTLSIAGYSLEVLEVYDGYVQDGGNYGPNAKTQTAGAISGGLCGAGGVLACSGAGLPGGPIGVAAASTVCGVVAAFSCEAIAESVTSNIVH